VTPVTAQKKSQKSKDNLPLGGFKYVIKTNGVKIGTAYVILGKKGRQYHSSAELSMRFNNVLTMTSEHIKETLKFKPIRYSSITRVVTGKNIQREKVTVNFKGRTAKIVAGSYKKTVKLKKSFILGGNYFLAKLLKMKMKNGSQVKALIYDASLAEDQLIEVTEKVVGREKFKLKNREYNLIHTIQKYGAIKNIHNYYNDKGILYRSVANMLNSEIEMTLEVK
jgi:hypothetical protein